MEPGGYRSEVVAVRSPLPEILSVEVGEILSLLESQSAVAEVAAAVVD